MKFSKAIGAATFVACCIISQSASAQPQPGTAAPSPKSQASGAAVAAPVVSGQALSVSPGVPAAPAPGGVVSPAVAPMGTVIELEITQLISSKTANIGDKFTFRLSAPIMAGGRVVVPADVPGVGEVIDAGHSGMGGHAGKLVLAGRYLDYHGKHLPVRALKLGGSGKDNANVALAVSTIPYVGLAAPFIQGGSIDIPVGSVAYAKLGADVVASDDIEPSAPATPVVPTSSSTAVKPAN